MENFMDIFPSIQDMEDLWLIVVDTLEDMYGEDRKSLFKDVFGVLIMITASVNTRHSEKQIDKAFDMSEDTKTDRICRQIRMLETRVWSQSWEIIFCIGVVVVFI